MDSPIIKIEGLNKSYSKVQVLQDINACVSRGDVIGIVGLNGAGKTTLMETILGFCLPDQGEVSVLGVPAAELSSSDIKARVGFVPQQDEMLGSLTGRQYLKLLSEYYDAWDKVALDRLCQDWQVPLDQVIETLSLGQRQKLSIVSALGHSPELLLLDEPVASLDPLARRNFLLELVALAADRGCTILFSTHIVSDIERIAERVWFIKEGKLIIDEAIDALKESTVNGFEFERWLSLEELFLEVHK